MKFSAFVIAGLLIASAALAQSGYIPTKGFVPDATTAISIARAVLIPIYGAEKIRKEEPLVALKKGNIWIVTGSMNCRACDGGVAELSLSVLDGKILHVIHGK